MLVRDRSIWQVGKVPYSLPRVHRVPPPTTRSGTFGLGTSTDGVVRVQLAWMAHPLLIDVDRKHAIADDHFKTLDDQVGGDVGRTAHQGDLEHVVSLSRAHLL